MSKISAKFLIVSIAVAIVYTLYLARFDHLEAKVNSVELSSLQPHPKHKKITNGIRHRVERAHYRRTKLNDELSRAILSRYLKSLDPTRSYFIEADIREFTKLQDRFDNYLSDTELTPAYAIFTVFRKRVEERVENALKLLDGNFDFERDESYYFDRSELPWATDSRELNDVWRKRVKNDVLNLRLGGKEPKEIVKTLTKRYQQLENRTSQLDSDDVFQIFINAYLASVEPHTSYFAPQAADSFKIHMSLSLEGIGAVLHSEDEYTVVRRVVTGGPADLHGELQAGDRIVGVAQGPKGNMEDVFGWRLDDVVDLIRGKKGSQVRLEILPEDAAMDGVTHEIVITRDKINLEEQAAQKSVIEVEGTNGVSRIGVIDLPTFYIDFDGRARGDPNYRSTTRDVRKLMQELDAEKVDGVIIDLRGNGGGALSEAITLTGLFIESGPIVQVRDSLGRIELNNDPDPSIVYSGPLAVLVDRFSASASEIFSGAIQDYRRGLIIGEPTFGKGTVQQLYDLDRLSNDKNVRFGQLKLTTAQFFRVNGDSTQHRGVVPDIVFPTASDADDEGERSLDNALPWATVSPANYRPFVAQLDANAFVKTRTGHSDRLHSVPALKYWLEGAELQMELRDRKEISLLESQRKIDREIQEKKEKEIEKQIRVARGLPAEKGNDEKTSGNEENDPSLDILLNETGRILADYVGWQHFALAEKSNLSNQVNIENTTTQGTSDQQSAVQPVQ